MCFTYSSSYKTIPSTFVDILAVRAFLMKFYTTVKQQDIHLITDFCENMSKND